MFRFYYELCIHVAELICCKELSSQLFTLLSVNVVISVTIM